MSKKKSYRVVSETGSLCPRCGVPAQEREHQEISARELKRPFYFSKWRCCRNNDCKTTVFNSDEYKVMNKNSAAQQMKERQEYSEQLSFLRSI